MGDFGSGLFPVAVHDFQPTGIIFKLVQDIIGMNPLTKFHEDQTKNVASRVKNAPPVGSHVFQANKTHVLTKFHEDWTKNVTSRVENCPAPWQPCFFTDLDHFQTRPRYQLKPMFPPSFILIGQKIVTSRVFTRNTAPPPGGHIFQQTGTIFKLNQHII
ncbi:hypothetical protein DPMN_087551 [Dreissena polymorpha]|uniref:Uncharacterized protein n=1 Tax=Dreissena polymorpha TaxID=45954 RepID=A0A9D4KUG4_DREPO|nr:hypothetical protein DPMN_087551 [Dreissena polymorpha]